MIEEHKFIKENAGKLAFLGIMFSAWIMFLPYELCINLILVKYAIFGISEVLALIGIKEGYKRRDIIEVFLGMVIPIMTIMSFLSV